MTAKFFIILIAITMLFIVQAERALDFQGVAPNLIFVFFVILLFSHVRQVFTLAFFPYVLLLAFWWTPFWILSFATMGLVLILIAVARDMMTGNQFIDAAIFSIFGTALFYVALNIKTIASLNAGLVAGEVVYNLLAMVFLWFVFTRFGLIRKRVA